MTTERTARWFRSGRVREGALYIVVTAMTTAAIILTLRLWRADLTVPFSDQGDALLISSHFKTILETGWYLEQPLLGAPHGQEYFDWKIADNLGMLFGVLMRPFTTDFGLVHNLYFCIGFPLAALTATWFLRSVGVSRLMTAALAILFALAPYHFLRGESHMWLASYFPLPLALVVVYRIVCGRTVWQWKTGGLRVGRLRLPPALATAAILLLVSVSNSYYAVITALLIAVSGLVALARNRSFARFWGAVGAGGLVAAVVAVSLVPSTVFSAMHGVNSSAVVRLPTEAELYAFKFTQLILPAPWHRLSIFRAFRSFYDQTYGNPAETPSLGIVASLGFVALLFCALLFLVPRRRTIAARQAQLRSRLGALSFLTVVCFLFGTVGGLGTIMSFVTSDLRGWNRISIFIALLGLASVGLLADTVWRRLPRTRAARQTPRRRRLAAIVAPILASTLVLAVGVWDQTSPFLIPNYAQLKTSFVAEQVLVDQIEAATSPNAMILELPYHPFPESMSAEGVLDSNQLKPYLHSHTLRWSGGGIKGRPDADWVAAVERLPAPDVVDTAVAAGFSGIFIDTGDLSASGKLLASGIADELGPPIVSSVDNRYLFYSLATASAALQSRGQTDLLERIGQVAVSPVVAQYLPRSDSYTVPQLFEPYSPRIVLENDRSQPVEVLLRFTLADTEGATALQATTPAGASSLLNVSAAGTPQELRLSVPPGRSTVSFEEVDGTAAARSVIGQGPIVPTQLSVTDVELVSLLAELRADAG